MSLDSQNLKQNIHNFQIIKWLCALAAMLKALKALLRDYTITPCAPNMIMYHAHTITR
uniref:Uncharacterized protein n=1 Tax=Anguilla anguilla TaxID=7936 RepID=A0A0E9X6B6_ANGAN